MMSRNGKRGKRKANDQDNNNVACFIPGDIGPARETG